MAFPGTLPVALAGAAVDFQGFIHPGSAMFDGTSGDWLLWPDPGTHSVSEDNPDKSTVSLWFRPGDGQGTRRLLLAGWTNAANSMVLELDASDRLSFTLTIASVIQAQLISTRVFKDPTAWYHLVFHYDSGNVTPDLRQRMWVSNDELAAFDVRTNPPLDYDGAWARGGFVTSIGGWSPSNLTFRGFVADVHHVDGSLVFPSVFGQVSPVHDEWIPKKVQGIVYGTQGFHVDAAIAADLGNDASGNNNDFTAQGAYGAANAFIDVPANTFPISNTVMDRSDLPDFSEAGLTANEASATSSGSHTTHVLPAGRWHFAVKKLSTGAGAFGCEVDGEYLSSRGGLDTIRNTRRGFAYRNDGAIIKDGVTQFTGASLTIDDVVDIYVDNRDPTNIKAWLAKNQVQQGSGSPDPEAGTDPVITYSNTHPYPEIPQLVPGMGHDTNGGGIYDFGQRRGSESFIGPTPIGFKRVSTGNFPIPNIAALRPNNYFGILAWGGDDVAARRIIDLDEVKFVPDMVWLKKRTGTLSSWRVAINMADYSPSPATPNNLRLDVSDAVADFTTGNIEGFVNGGFDVADGATSGQGVNDAASTYLAWCFKADPAAGFVIVRAKGTGVARTIAHNLGAKPELIIGKQLDGANNWVTYNNAYGHVSDPESDYNRINVTGPAVADLTVWDNTPPTDTEFSVGTSAQVNALNGEYVFLLFRSIPGFLKCPSYEGNTNADGAFQPTDFAVRAFFGKSYNGNQPFFLHDDVMNPDGNQKDRGLLPTTNNSEQSLNSAHDTLANGWKMRANSTLANTASRWMFGLMYADVAARFARGR